jgi:hypothetical protein|tara:strand:- start:20492 stop:20791 length:300 start_codon:yes stop_codon:yes gene_type:complete
MKWCSLDHPTQKTKLKQVNQVISQEITLDKLIEDIDQQIEIISAIANENAILLEQLRLLQESRELLVNQDMEISRLVEVIDPDVFSDHSTLLERNAEKE